MIPDEFIGLAVYTESHSSRANLRHFFKACPSSIHKLKTTPFLALSVAIFGLFATSHSSLAEDATSFAKIDVAYHPGTNVLEITGIVYKTFSQDYALTIFNPQGHLIFVSQPHLSQNDTFSQSVVAAGPLWSEPGNYTVKLASGSVVLSEQSSYFPGASCCVQNSQGIQAGISETTNVIGSPLKQFKSGIAANDVKCRQDLQLVIKSEDGSPACVKPQTAQKLVERGWAKEIVSSASTEKTSQINPAPLELLLSINSTIIRPNQTLGIDIVLNNTSPNVLVKDSQNDWPMEGLSMGPCELDPIGIGVYKGNYSPENVTGTRPLQLYQNGTYQCPMLVGVDRYVFESSSDKAISETGNGNSTGEMRYDTSFHGYYTRGGFVLPSVGVYTVVAGDKWGNLAIRHFTVTNSTVSNVLQTSQIIPQCVSNIPHPYAMAGPPGSPLCPVAGFQASGQIVNSTGFYGIYNYTKFPNTQNFVLEPGHNATITYKISVGSIHSWASTSPSNEINLTNYVTLMHDAEMHDHPDVYVSVYPASEMIPQNDSAIVTITLSASKNAPYGTYWMQLPPGFCFGGEDIILTVTDCTGKK